MSVFAQVLSLQLFSDCPVFMGCNTPALIQDSTGWTHSFAGLEHFFFLPTVLPCLIFLRTHLSPYQHLSLLSFKANSVQVLHHLDQCKFL